MRRVRRWWWWVYRRYQRHRAVARLGQAWGLAATLHEHIMLLEAQLERLDYLIKKELERNGEDEEG